MLTMSLNNGKTVVITDHAGAGSLNANEITLEDYIKEELEKKTDESK